MESDISELIETAVPTDNEEEEEDSIPVEPVDEEERFEDGFEDEEPVLYEPEPGPLELQRAEPVEVLSDYEREGQVIVGIKTRTKRPRPPRVKKRARSGISRQQRRGSNGQKNAKRSNLSWSLEQHVVVRKTKAKPKQTKDQLIKELSKM